MVPKEQRMIMGCDISVLLLDSGIRDLGDNANLSYLDGICPMSHPTLDPPGDGHNTSTSGGDGSAVSSQIPRYIWRGGGTYRFCDGHDSDYYNERLPEPGTGGGRSPEKLFLTRLEKALKTMLAQNHPSCFSETAKVDVTFTEVRASEICVFCSNKAEPPVFDSTLDYVEPPFFAFYEGVLGSDFMKRCVKRRVPPADGDFCRRAPKACLFGEQTCPTSLTLGGATQPTVRCDCDDGSWACQTFACPSIGPACPAVADPSTANPALICSNDLTCTYSATR
jgi:hypothetical protein